MVADSADFETIGGSDLSGADRARNALKASVLLSDEIQAVFP
jgi:hypothetical protein